MAASLLADMGARVIRIERREAIDLGVDKGTREQNMLLRGRQAIALDLKDPKDVATVLEFAQDADSLIEGFRPSPSSPVPLPLCGPIAASSAAPVARQITMTSRASGKPTPGAWVLGWGICLNLPSGRWCSS